MEKLGPFEIAKVQESLWLDVNSSFSNQGKTKLEVWKVGQRKTHKKIVTDIVNKVIDADKLGKPMKKSDIFGELKNEAIRWGGNILCAGKVFNVRGRSKFIVFVGAGGIFAAAEGSVRKEAGHAAMASWTSKFVDTVRVNANVEAGVSEVLDEWWADDEKNLLYFESILSINDKTLKIQSIYIKKQN